MSASEPRPATAAGSNRAAVVDPRLSELANPPTSHRALALSRRLAGEEGERWIDVWVEGSVSRHDLAALGARVGTTAGNLTSVQVPAAALNGLLAVPGLERAQLASSVTFQSDLSVPLIGARDLWGTSKLPPYSATGKTGRRVVIGIVDSGVDYKSKDFKQYPDSSKTRIKYYWDQTWTSSPTPSFGYGREYTAGAIDSNKCSASDYTGHGTMMAGIAAGAGRATGNGQQEYRYIGAAPEADIVVVQLAYYFDGSVPDTRIIDGINYVFQKAAQLGEPAIVIVAASKWSGPHDGHDPLDRAIAALTGPGKIVCSAGGNFGGLARHAEWTSTASGQTGTMTFSLGNYVASATADDNMCTESWYDATANYSVSVTTPGGVTVGPVARGATTTAYTSGGIVVVNNGVYTSDNGSYRVDVQMYRGDMAMPAIQTGSWTLKYTSQTSGTHRVDSWITGYNLGIMKPVFVTGMTEKYTVGSPATANNVIAVGAWSSRSSWTAVDGRTYSMSGVTANDLAPFSGVGPRRDGVIVPHIAAPGCGVAASRKSTYYPATSYFMPDSAHVMSSGTSSAAALTGGALALVLQDHPTWTPAQVQTYLQQNAVTDAMTGTGTALPNARWGYGKLHVASGSSLAAEPMLPLASGLELVSRNPSRGPYRFEFGLTVAEAAEAKAAPRLEVFDAAGRVLATVHAQAMPGSQTLEWSGRTAGGGAVEPGVYWARVIAGRRESVAKFITLR